LSFAKFSAEEGTATMDASRLLLHKSNMTKRKSPAKAPIPTYELYGEDDPAGSRFWVHCETIPARSALHHWEIGLHRHERYFQILLVTGGSGDAVFDGEVARFEPVSVVTVPPAVGHGFRFSPDIDGYVFTFLASRLPVRPGEPNALGRFLSTPLITRLAPQDPDGDLVLAHLIRVVAEWQGRLTGRTVLMETGLAAALALTARLAAQDRMETEGADDNDRRLEAFSSLLHREVRNHRPASFYADALGITPTHLNRVLKAKTGFGTQELVAQRLIEETQRELLFTPGSIKEVAFRLGFSDPAYFSRFFSRQTGLTPGAWREQEQVRLGSREENADGISAR
jgi:AraC family transcriptional activator of pobA